MSLPVLAALVVVGIGLIVAAIHFTGGSRAVSLDDEDLARQRFGLDHSLILVEDVHLTSDRRSAFLETEDGRIGLVHAVGARFLTRLVGPGDVASVERIGENTLRVRFRDFTFSGARFEFADASAANTLETALRHLESGRRAA